MASNIRIGDIPTKLVYIYGEGSKKKIKRHMWDRIDVPIDEDVEVIPAFCTSATNNKSIETGKHWATKAIYKWDEKAQRSIQVSTQEPVIKAVDNKPLVGLKIVNLETHSQGGRAYKVVTNEGFYFDLREDVLLDTILRVGIQPGGVLDGEFLWARVGSQMKLIRANSELHKALKETTIRGKKKKIPNSELEVGTIYRTKSGITKVLLGFVDTKVYGKTQETYEYQRGSWAWGVNNRLIKPSKYYSRTQKNHGLWLELHNSEIDQKTFDTKLQSSGINTWGYSISKNHSFIESIGKLIVPTDVIQIKKEQAYTYIKNANAKYACLQLERFEPRRHDFYSSYVINASAFLNMVPTGTEMQTSQWCDILEERVQEDKGRENE